MPIRAWIANYKVPPGVCVAVLGAAAAIYTILPADYMSPRERGSFIVGITLLMVTEITVLHRERERQQREVVAIQADGHSRFIVTQTKLAVIEQLHRIGIRESFKRHALEFIRSLIDFFSNQVLGGPERNVTLGELLAGDDPAVFERYKEMKRFQIRAMEEYKSTLAPKIMVLRDQLKDHGLVDEELNARLINPSSSLDIALVITKLEELVAKLD